MYASTLRETHNAGERRRAHRRRVFIPAAARTGHGRINVLIKDVSTGGLLLELPLPLGVGTFVEVTHGQQISIGRVVWSDDRFAGVTFQDEIDVDTWLTGMAGAKTPALEVRYIADRGSSSAQAARAKSAGRKLEFVGIVAAAALSAAAVAAVAYWQLNSLAQGIGAALGN